MCGLQTILVNEDVEAPISENMMEVFGVPIQVHVERTKARNGGKPGTRRCKVHPILVIGTVTKS
jgi:hypothetical protein